MIDWLKGTPGYTDSYAYQTITKHYNADDSKSIALRLVIHLWGDLHQPLHDLNRVNPTYPTGDAGGNAFPLPSHYSVDNLHSLWDDLIYENHVSQALPFTDATWASFGTETNNIKNKYSISDSDIHKQNVYTIS